MSRERITTAVEILGACSCSAGAWMIAPAFGLILAGVFLILAGGLLS